MRFPGPSRRRLLGGLAAALLGWLGLGRRRAGARPAPPRPPQPLPPARGDVTHLTYDAAGQLVHAETADPARSRRAVRDGRGRVVAVLDGAPPTASRRRRTST